MSYTIKTADGSTLVVLGDRKIDQSTTSLTLVGKNWAGYGEYLNNNFVKLLGSNASSSSNPPRSPLKGQLWYDTTAKRLKVYDEDFKAVAGAIVSSTQPEDMISGDVWFDTLNRQLFVAANNTLYLIGPLFPFPNSEGIGFVQPKPTVKDFDNNVKDISLLKNHGQLLGYIANEVFTFSTASTYAYLTATTTSTVKGLTVFGDINYTGKIANKYLSLNVDFDVIFSPSVATNRDISNTAHFAAQTNAIVQILKSMYPVNETTGTVTVASSVETGVPVGSEVKVLCRFSLPSTGYQVRRFKAIGGSQKWDMVTIVNDPTGTLTNVVSTFYQGSF